MAASRAASTVCLLRPDGSARAVSERAVAIESGEGSHHFSVDSVIVPELEALAAPLILEALAAPLISDVLVGKPTVLVLQGDAEDGALTQGLAACALRLLFQKIEGAPSGVSCTLTISCVRAEDALFDLLDAGTQEGAPRALASGQHATDAPATNEALCMGMLSVASSRCGSGHMVVRLRLQTEDVELRSSRSSTLHLVTLSSAALASPSESSGSVDLSAARLAEARCGAADALLEALAAPDAAAVQAAALGSALTAFLWPPPATAHSLCRALLVTACGADAAADLAALRRCARATSRCAEQLHAAGADGADGADGAEGGAAAALRGALSAEQAAAAAQRLRLRRADEMLRQATRTHEAAEGAATSKRAQLEARLAEATRAVAAREATVAALQAARVSETQALAALGEQQQKEATLRAAGERAVWSAEVRHLETYADEWARYSLSLEPAAAAAAAAAGGGAPSSPAGAAGASNPPRVPGADALYEMGFGDAAVRGALARSRGNVAAAAEILLASPTPTPTPPPATAAAAGGAEARRLVEGLAAMVQGSLGERWRWRPGATDGGGGGDGVPAAWLRSVQEGVRLLQQDAAREAEAARALARMKVRAEGAEEEAERRRLQLQAVEREADATRRREEALHEQQHALRRQLDAAEETLYGADRSTYNDDDGDGDGGDGGDGGEEDEYDEGADGDATPPSKESVADILGHAPKAKPAAVEAYDDFEYEPFGAGGMGGVGGGAAAADETSEAAKGATNTDGRAPAAAAAAEATRAAGGTPQQPQPAQPAQAAQPQPPSRLKAWWQRISSPSAESVFVPSGAMASYQGFEAAPPAPAPAAAAAAAVSAKAARVDDEGDAVESAIQIQRAHVLCPGLSPQEAARLAEQLGAQGMRVTAPSPWRARLVAEELTEDQMFVLCSHPLCKGLETIALEQDGIRASPARGGSAAHAAPPPTHTPPPPAHSGAPPPTPPSAGTSAAATAQPDAARAADDPPPRVAGVGVASRAAANDLMLHDDGEEEDEVGDDPYGGESAAMSIFNGLSSHFDTSAMSHLAR